MNRQYKDNPMVIHLPSGVGLIQDDLEIEKIRIDYDVISDQNVFSVCIDDFLYINEKYKLVDDDTKKAFFGRTAKLKDNKEKVYSSLDARAVSVITAIMEGKISLDENVNSQ